MSSTKEKLPKLPAYCLPSFWLTMLLMLVATVLSFTDLLHFNKKRAESARRSEELSLHYRDEVLAIKRAQIDNLKEIKDRLIVLEVAIGKIKPEKKPKPVASSPSAESAISLESMSNAEYQSMVLGHVKASDRQLVDQHFKQENAFKASLKPAEKQKFDTDVKKAYAKLLAHPGMKGELSSLQKSAIHRSAESMVIVEWRTRESTESRESQMRRSNERWLNQQEEKNRLREEERLAKLVERFGPDILDQLQKEAVDERSRFANSELKISFDAHFDRVNEILKKIKEDLKKVDGDLRGDGGNVGLNTRMDRLETSKEEFLLGCFGFGYRRRYPLFQSDWKSSRNAQ